MVVSESPIGDALASLHTFLAVFLITSAAALALMLLAGGLLARRISAPIRSVAEAARRIAGGDLSSRATYQKRDEVGALVASFNSLVDGLISSREEVRSQNRELEAALSQLSRVRDRLVQIEAISAVGRVAASLVHEIRNPLSSVKMNLQILSKPLSGDERYAEHGRIALDQLERLERMLGDLLDFGRPLDLRVEEVKLADCMERAAGDVRARARAREIEITTAGADGISLAADPSRIAQALVNLLANAVDASPPGSRVELAGSEEFRDGARWVRCEVRDRGSGIRAEHREEIFNPFFTTKEGGTGLGLAMVRKIAALHGGRVELESRPEGGTVMRLVLPGEEAAHEDPRC
jgi:two-component system sensor histidine kinase AtoS